MLYSTAEAAAQTRGSGRGDIPVGLARRVARRARWDGERNIAAPLAIRRGSVVECGAKMNPLSDARLYGILDLGYTAAPDLERVAAEMLAGGVDVLQLRAKTAAEAEIEALANRLVPLTESAGVPLIVNDFPQLVPAVGAQGAHVGQDDFPVADARWRAGRALAGEVPAPLIGKSTHNFAQAVSAAAEGADYIGFGPLFLTPTKPGRPAIGCDEIRRVHDAVTIPIFCIGGIKLANLETVIAAGARRVVIVSELLQAAEIAGYIRRVKALLGSV